MDGRMSGKEHWGEKIKDNDSNNKNNRRNNAVFRPIPTQPSAAGVPTVYSTLLNRIQVSTQCNSTLMTIEGSSLLPSFGRGKAAYFVPPCTPHQPPDSISCD